MGKKTDFKSAAKDKRSNAIKGQRWVKAPDPLLATLHKDSNLNLRQIGLYGYISGLAETGEDATSVRGRCNFSIRELAAREGISEITIRRDLKALEFESLIEVQGRRRNGVQVYVLDPSMITSVRAICTQGMSQMKFEQHLDHIEKMILKRCDEGRMVSQIMSQFSKRKRLQKQGELLKEMDSNVALRVSLEGTLDKSLRATHSENATHPLDESEINSASGASRPENAGLDGPPLSSDGPVGPSGAERSASPSQANLSSSPNGSSQGASSDPARWEDGDFVAADEGGVSMPFEIRNQLQASLGVRYKPRNGDANGYESTNRRSE